MRLFDGIQSNQLSPSPPLEQYSSAQLPAEIWLRIADHLPKSEILRLRSLNRPFFSLALDIRFYEISLRFPHDYRQSKTSYLEWRKDLSLLGKQLSEYSHRYITERVTKLYIYVKTVTSYPHLGLGSLSLFVQGRNFVADAFVRFDGSREKSISQKTETFLRSLKKVRTAVVDFNHLHQLGSIHPPPCLTLFWNINGAQLTELTLLYFYLDLDPLLKGVTCPHLKRMSIWNGTGLDGGACPNLIQLVSSASSSLQELSIKWLYSLSQTILEGVRTIQLPHLSSFALHKKHNNLSTEQELNCLKQFIMTYQSTLTKVDLDFKGVWISLNSGFLSAMSHIRMTIGKRDFSKIIRQAGLRPLENLRILELECYSGTNDDLIEHMSIFCRCLSENALRLERLNLTVGDIPPVTIKAILERLLLLRSVQISVIYKIFAIVPAEMVYNELVEWTSSSEWNLQDWTIRGDGLRLSYGSVVTSLTWTNSGETDLSQDIVFIPLV